jgi:hypothetical protein
MQSQERRSDPTQAGMPLVRKTTEAALDAVHAGDFQYVSLQGMDALSQHCRCLLLEHGAPRKVVLFGLFRPRANLML